MKRESQQLDSKIALDAQEHPELVPRRLEMNKDKFSDKPHANIYVCPIFRQAQNYTELVTEIVQALVTGMQGIYLVTAQ